MGRDGEKEHGTPEGAPCLGLFGFVACAWTVAIARTIVATAVVAAAVVALVVVVVLCWLAIVGTAFDGLIATRGALIAVALFADFLFAIAVEAREVLLFDKVNGPLGLLCPCSSR